MRASFAPDLYSLHLHRSRGEQRLLEAYRILTIRFEDLLDLQGWTIDHIRRAQVPWGESSKHHPSSLAFIGLGGAVTVATRDLSGVSSHEFELEWLRQAIAEGRNDLGAWRIHTVYFPDRIPVGESVGLKKVERTFRGH